MNHSNIACIAALAALNASACIASADDDAENSDAVQEAVAPEQAAPQAAQAEQLQSPFAAGAPCAAPMLLAAPCPAIQIQPIQIATPPLVIPVVQPGQATVHTVTTPPLSFPGISIPDTTITIPGIEVPGVTVPGISIPVLDIAPPTVSLVTIPGSCARAAGADFEAAGPCDEQLESEEALPPEAQAAQPQQQY